MADINRNNLDKASSPYLRQHYNNPIHWQEWTKEVLEYARNEDKPILVSIGYSTCHWCHVMASEAFSDKDIAVFLNQHFICIKVDREQRPDIDSYFMEYAVSTNGSGGWPLNMFLSSKGDPITALTYVPDKPKYGMPGMLSILKQILKHKKGNEWESTKRSSPSAFFDENIVGTIISQHDWNNGGFGKGQKFPPHNTLLYLLYELEYKDDEKVRKLLVTTLDHIADRGLFDHLRGGFFRYCVDSRWQIPHFEKMLYDQAMMLWVYALASRVLNEERYMTIAKRTLDCLLETFEQDGLFLSAHDADTDHVEGATYVWSQKELEDVLTLEEYAKFVRTYSISQEGNFEGKNHLIKLGGGEARRQLSLAESSHLSNIEKKLLSIRDKRLQPFADKKIVTSWNALVGIAMVNYWRNTSDRDVLERAISLFEELMRKHHKDGRLVHSSIDGKYQSQEFLEDYSSMLLFSTYLHEDTGSHLEEVELFTKSVQKFKEEYWIEGNNSDFRPVKASGFDHPSPSSISMAELGLIRSSILQGVPIKPSPFKNPLENDFYNISAQISNSRWHTIHSPRYISWDKLPANAIQVRSSYYQDCYKFKCVDQKTEEDLMNMF